MLMGLLIASVALIVLSMLFSISESAFLSMNKLRLRILRKERDKRALRVGRLLEKKELLINTLLVANELVNILLSSIITAVAMKLFGRRGVGYATFVVTLLLLVFALELALVPANGETAKGLILPVITLSLSPMANITRLTRSSMLDVLGQDYIRTARAKGVSQIKIIFGHALKNSLIPVITYFGPMLAYIVTAVVLEFFQLAIFAAEKGIVAKGEYVGSHSFGSVYIILEW